jgi:hypothetical protein
MKGSMIGKCCSVAAGVVLGWMSSICGAQVFYSGLMQGLPGDSVDLFVNARSGTVLESIDILPEPDAFPSVLHFVSLLGTPAMFEDGIGQCTGETCGVFYNAPRTFASDTLLATLRLSIDSGAPAGLVAFDPGVFVGDDPFPGATLEVLAVPEPSSWVMFLLGSLVIGCVIRGRTGAKAVN